MNDAKWLSVGCPAACPSTLMPRRQQSQIAKPSATSAPQAMIVVRATVAAQTIIFGGANYHCSTGIQIRSDKNLSVHANVLHATSFLNKYNLSKIDQSSAIPEEINTSDHEICLNIIEMWWSIRTHRHLIVLTVSQVVVFSVRCDWRVLITSLAMTRRLAFWWQQLPE